MSLPMNNIVSLRTAPNVPHFEAIIEAPDARFWEMVIFLGGAPNGRIKAPNERRIFVLA